MNKNVLPVLAKSVLALLVAVGTATSFAQAKKEVTFAHQDMQLPYRILMDAELEKATGYKINWRMFGGGGEVIKAMSSGDVQIGEVGSSPWPPPPAKAKICAWCTSWTILPHRTNWSRVMVRASTAGKTWLAKKWVRRSRPQPTTP